MGDEITVVGSYADSIQAQFAVLKLANAGIEARVFDEGIVTANPFLGPAVGGIRVVVRVSDAEAATAVLELKPEAKAEDRKCPTCSSANTSESPAGLRWTFLSILLLGFPIGRSRNLCRCEDCGHTWRE